MGHEFYPAERVATEFVVERMRQIHGEGWTEGHDDAHVHGDLAQAAAAYALRAGLAAVDDPADFWPWDRATFKPGSIRRDLVKAGALIIAEIERLDRAKAKEEE